MVFCLALLAIILVSFSSESVHVIDSEKQRQFFKQGHITIESLSSGNVLIIAEGDKERVVEVEVIAQTPNSLPGVVFAKSIEGTEVDGRLKSDENGNLIIDLEVRDLFDYFLNTVADVAPEVAMAELQKFAVAYLPASAAKQAMVLLDDYLNYKETAIELMNQPLLPQHQQDADYQIQQLQFSFEQLKQIRRQTMSEEAVTAFFSLEEAYGSYTIETIKIENNKMLSAGEKAAQLELQRSFLPDMIRNTETQIAVDAENLEEINTILISDLSDEQVFITLQGKGLQQDALEDAMRYRREQRSFELSYQKYKVERDLLFEAGLSEMDKNSQVELLRKRYFLDERTLTQARVKDLQS
mgnify:CR=1 FL=1